MSRDERPNPDPTLLDEALHLLPGPVAVVGAAVAGQTGGLTAAWLTRTSHKPPLLMVSIGHERYTHGLLMGSHHFTVSVLREGQVDLARHFGLQSQRDMDKWSTVESVVLGQDLCAGGVPALAHCSARFLCTIRDRFCTGDHDCFVGEVVQAALVDGGPPLPLRAEDYRD